MAKSSMIGNLSLHHDGYGFVTSETQGDPDVFVPAHAIGDAMHRDRVEVSIQKGRGDKLEGRIIKIVERGLTQLVGRYELRGKSAIAVTDDLRVHKRVVIPMEKSAGAHHNEMVIVHILEYPSGDKPVVAEVVKRLGTRGSDETELNILIARHNLPGKFPEKVIADAKLSSDKFTKEDGGRREDLTNLPFITIDGEDAKDFDDAVCSKRLDDGSIRVWISIADVSHFVQEGSAVDREAAARATSTYFPGFVIPMLPEVLSNDTCSLVPYERRYCFTAEMIIDKEGRTKSPKFYRSVIKSKYRMTYTEANDYLSFGKEITNDKEILASLKGIHDAAAAFRSLRKRRGSIDFDLPEPEIVVGMTGKPENIVKAERNIAHMLIEDLMIAANEAVATFLTRKAYPRVYRVHDQPNPEKLDELTVLLKYLGHKISIVENPDPMVIANIVRKIEGRPEERVVNMLILRSMAKAIYSTNNIGHFGLASNCYCHFTSPIRRYPDLLIHRLLAHALGLDKKKKLRPEYLKSEAERSSKMERRSMESEREAHDLYAAIFMRDKIGEVYDGLVSHAAKKGLFVELLEFFVEGLIKPEDLTGDSYKFDQQRFSYTGKKSGKSFQIGDKMKVRVKDVSIEERRIYFEPVLEHDSPRRKR